MIPKGESLAAQPSAGRRPEAPGSIVSDGAPRRGPAGFQWSRPMPNYPPTGIRALALASVLPLIACALASSAIPTPNILVEPTSRPTTTAPGPATTAVGAEIVFYHGTLLTIEPGAPPATALLLRGELIAAVGSDEEVLSQASPDAQLIDLGGRTLMPGFVDAHSHMFGDVPPDPDYTEVQDTLLRYGVTTTTEMWVDEPILQRLTALDARGALRVRLNVYLGHNTSCGEPLGDWYRKYSVTRVPGERFRISGVKIFSDGGSCNVPAVSFEYPGGYGQGDLYFTAPQLETLIRELDAAGYQVAIHALGDRALDVVLQAYTDVLHGVNPRRHRIEHNAVLRPDQLPLYTQAGAVATIFGPFQTCITLGDRSRFRYLVPESHQTWEWPWRDLLDANPNVHFAWHGDMPGVFTPDVFQHLYGFVTRSQVAEDGTICQAPDWLARNALSVDEALQLMTMGAAYALDRETEIGSLVPGKYADLNVLSANPETIPPADLKDLKVLMTMVSGNVEYCADGMEALCPATPDAAPTGQPGPSTTFRDDFDGALDPGWSWYQGEAPGWTLSNMPGWLRLNLSTGSFFGDLPPSNLLIRPAPSGDFDLKAWVRFSPVRNFELAGLVVVFDEASVLQFGRGFCEVPAGPTSCIGDGLYFDSIQNGSPVGGNFATQSFLGVDYLLRLQRQGNSYDAAYSTDGSSWVPLGSHTVDRPPVSMGLIAAQAETPGNFADFDYVEITDGP